MDGHKSYTGIDYFRFLAAFLVIAIHTSPLSSYNETADFILTRIFARVAVPFFFMTTGFFLIKKYNRNAGRLMAFIKKTALLYGAVMLLYIPLNIYSGYFSMDHLLPNILKDIIFDGTVYHLWYLPASIIGGTIAWILVRKCGFKWAFMMAFALYIIGMFGDSYYGITNNFPFFTQVYKGIFEITDYTRNGIFFAPVFFVLGGLIAEQSGDMSLKSCLLVFFISTALLLIEGMLLYSSNLQRHDSMYFFLLPVMYFLFLTLTFWRGRRALLLQTSALIIYIIHPMIIVIIRMAAKIFQIQTLLVENSLMHFLAVSVVSAAITILCAFLLYKKKPKQKITVPSRAWIEIDLNNLKHNIITLRQILPAGCEIMAVVKAEAYGHGAFEMTTYMNQMGIKAFAVATLEEGIALRKYGIDGEILILGYTDPRLAGALHKYGLTQTLIDYNYAMCLNNQKHHVKTHIKIDTGMHRLGFGADDICKILEVFAAKYLSINGIYTHLCTADSLKEEDIDFTRRQIKAFYKTLAALKNHGLRLPKVHIQSSYGLLNYPELTCDYVRIGIALYGVLSTSKGKTRLQPELRPVLALKSQVVLIRKVKSGDSVGYGRDFTVARDSQIAILSVGYADGLPRSYENGEVLIHGRRAPIVGRICMDQTAIDITDVPNVSIGDRVTLIGPDGLGELNAEEMADSAGSITNELLSRMGSRLSVIVKSGN